MKKVIDFERELKNLISDSTKNFKFKGLENNKVVDKELTGYIGQVPRENLDDLIPCFTITTNGKNTLQQKNLSTKIGVALYSEDTEKGYEQLENIIEKIAKEIIQRAVILMEFEVLPEWEWKMIDETTYPFFGAEIFLNIVMRNDIRTDADALLTEEWR